MQVKELEEAIQNHETEMHLVNTQAIEVQDEVLNFERKDDNYSIPLEEETFKTFSRFFNIQKRLLPTLPSDLSRLILNWFIDNQTDGELIFETTKYDTEADEGKRKLINIYSPTEKLIKREEFLEVVQNHVDPQAMVRELDLTAGNVKLAIVEESKSVEPREGDVTAGGILLRGHVSTGEHLPQVSSYLERLVCSNGMVSPEESYTVTIKGNTVPEILTELDQAAGLAMQSVPTQLDQFKHLDDVALSEYNIDRLVNRMLNDAGISNRVAKKILDDLTSFNGSTLYDLVNFVTEYQNREGINDVQRDRIQLLGGQSITSFTEHRCPQCAQPVE